MKASRVLLIMICLVTSLAFGIVYVYRYVYPKDVVASTVSSRSVADASGEAQAASEDTLVAAPTVTYSAFPRLAYVYDGVTVGVTGTKGTETYLDHYAFGGYVYVMLSTDTDGEDYRATGPSLAVARFDEGCTLTDTVTLPRSSGYTYLAAAMYDYGVMLVASSSTDLRVWTVSTNLTVRTAAYPYVATAARLLYADGLNVLCATGDTLHLLALTADLQTAWYHATPTTQSLVALYAYGEQLVAFCTDRTSGSAYVFDKQGYRTRAVLPAVSAVTPFAGGYAVASLADCTLSFLDYQFARTGAMTFAAGTRAVRLASYDKGVLLMADGHGYLLCNHGDVQYTFATPLQVAGTVEWRDDRFYFATAYATTTTVYTYRPFDAAPVESASYVGAALPDLFVRGGYVYCLCTSTFDYGYFQGSLGDADVYLLRRSLTS